MPGLTEEPVGQAREPEAGQGPVAAQGTQSCASPGDRHASVASCQGRSVLHSLFWLSKSRPISTSPIHCAHRVQGS